jgi:hypothetical protein
MFTALGLIGASVVPAASAYKLTGTAYKTGAPVPSQLVKIYNYCASAWGSTYADANGNFSFSGMTSGCDYDLTGDHCWVHSYYAGETIFTQPASDSNENLYLLSQGYSC